MFTSRHSLRLFSNKFSRKPRAKTFYDVLQIDKGASAKDIKKAYKSMAMKHHPDAQEGSEEQFKKISEAYQTLHDPAEK